MNTHRFCTLSRVYSGTALAVLLLLSTTIGACGSSPATGGGAPAEVHDLESPPLFGFVLSEDLRVLSVDKGSPADRAGMRTGDTLVAANGTPLSSGATAAEQITRLALRQSTDRIPTPLTVERSGRRVTVKLRLGYPGVTPEPNGEVDGGVVVIPTGTEPDTEATVIPGPERPTPTPDTRKVHYL